jgi:hypothetical protein
MKTAVALVLVLVAVVGCGGHETARYTVGTKRFRITVGRCVHATDKQDQSRRLAICAYPNTTGIYYCAIYRDGAWRPFGSNQKNQEHWDGCNQTRDAAERSGL